MLEDDAQNGPDHVDAHRTPALVISPYTKRRGGFHHVFHLQHVADDGADPGPEADDAVRRGRTADVPVFQSKPDLTPYEYLPARVDLNERNDATAYGAAESGKMDFRDADAADDRRLNEIIWRSVRAPAGQLPRRSMRRSSRRMGSKRLIG